MNVLDQVQSDLQRLHHTRREYVAELQDLKARREQIEAREDELVKAIDGQDGSIGYANHLIQTIHAAEEKRKAEEAEAQRLAAEELERASIEKATRLAERILSTDAIDAHAERVAAEE